MRELGPGRHLLVLEVADIEAPVELTVSARGRPILRRELRLADL